MNAPFIVPTSRRTSPFRGLTLRVTGMSRSPVGRDGIAAGGLIKCLAAKLGTHRVAGLLSGPRMDWKSNLQSMQAVERRLVRIPRPDPRQESSDVLLVPAILLAETGLQLRFLEQR